MRDLLIDLADLIEPPNYKPRSDQHIAAIAQSMAKVGQITPITVREFCDQPFVIADGGARVAALRLLAARAEDGQAPQKVRCVVVACVTESLTVDARENAMRAPMTWTAEQLHAALACQQTVHLNGWTIRPEGTPTRPLYWTSDPYGSDNGPFDLTLSACARMLEYTREELTETGLPLTRFDES